MQDSLLSRFDLLFIVLDQVNTSQSSNFQFDIFIFCCKNFVGLSYQETHRRVLGDVVPLSFPLSVKKCFLDVKSGQQTYKRTSQDFVRQKSYLLATLFYYN